jgi:hypothetical protein
VQDFAIHRRRRFDLVLGLAMVATLAAALTPSPLAAQDLATATTAPGQAAKANANTSQRSTGAKPTRVAKGPYYVDFRARTAASYGHAFIWYGRVGERAVEVAGLHPATESVIPYIIGHVLPVPSETGASYGDLDEQYVTASYRVYLSEPEAKRVFAQIRHMQATSPVWNAAVSNCVGFISDIAQFIGLRTPSSNLLYPEDWVNQLRALNSGSQPAEARAAATQSMPQAAQARAAATQPISQPADARAAVTQSIY